MMTVAEYLEKKLPIIPCGNNILNKDTGVLEYKAKVPRIKNWETTDFKAADFIADDNIGLKLKDHTDIDIDHPKALPFVDKYIEPCGALFGRYNLQTAMHHLFKTKSKFKKFVLHPLLVNFYKDFSHGANIIECRSGENKQTIMPGSLVDGKEEGDGILIEWKRLESISPYSGNLFEDISKVAFATALSILYPPSGNRDDYTYAVACILAKNTDWQDFEIDEFITHLAANSGDEESRSGKGTHAFKQLENGGNMMGFNTIRQIIGLEDAQPIYKIFEWIGINPPDKNLEDLKKKSIFIVDSASMMNLETGIEVKKTDFNDQNLFKFPGGKGKKTAFASLMTDPEFQEKLVIGRAVLPGYDYPIADVGPDHFHLKPGRYLNLYPGPPNEPVKGDVKPWVDAYKRIYGEVDYEYIEQYFAALIQKIFKHKLKLTAEEDAEIGEVKIMWGFLIVGPEGTAKKGLAQTLQRIIGKEFVDANATYDQMIGSHSEVIYNKLFVCINEVVTTGDISKKIEISNKLKPFWTDEDCKINPKHIRPFRYYNNCNGICFSNEEDCLHIGKGSRRYGVINQFNRLTLDKIEEMEEDGTFTGIYKFLESGKAKHLFHHLLYDVKVKDWKLFRGGRAPKTDATQQMIDDNAHPVQQRLSRALETRSAPFDDRFPGFVVLDDLLDYIKEKWKINVNPKYVKDWIKDVQFPWSNGKTTRQIVLEENGSRPRAHKLLDHPHLDEMSEGELGSAPRYDGWQWAEHKLKHSLKNNFQMDFSSGATPEDVKRGVVANFLEKFFGMKWSDAALERFLVDCISTMQVGNKRYSKIILDCTDKETRVVNWDEVWRLAANEKSNKSNDKRKKIKAAHETFTDEVLKGKPSEILYDGPLEPRKKKTINL